MIIGGGDSIHTYTRKHTTSGIYILILRTYFTDLPRISRQGAEGANQEVDDSIPDINAIAQAGERCVEKVMMTEETVYDDVIECHHSYDQKCHTTYKTIYDPQQMEVCEEIFEKLCYIEYKKEAEDETVQICNELLSRDCEDTGK